MCQNCNHDMWDHEFVDESDDSLIFGECEIKDCKCEQFES